jgi:hypothetical protein
MASKNIGGNNGAGGKKPSKNVEKYFGSEVDLKIKGVLNPPQKPELGEKVPPPPPLSTKKVSKDATQQESIKELSTKLKAVANIVATAKQKTSESQSPSKIPVKDDIGTKFKDQVLGKIGATNIVKDALVKNKEAAQDADIESAKKAFSNEEQVSF